MGVTARSRPRQCRLFLRFTEFLLFLRFMELLSTRRLRTPPCSGNTPQVPAQLPFPLSPFLHRKDLYAGDISELLGNGSMAQSLTACSFTPCLAHSLPHLGFLPTQYSPLPDYMLKWLVPYFHQSSLVPSLLRSPHLEGKPY